MGRRPDRAARRRRRRRSWPSDALDLTPIAAAHDEHRERTQAQRAQTEHRLGLIDDGARAGTGRSSNGWPKGSAAARSSRAGERRSNGPALWELVDFGERLTRAPARRARGRARRERAADRRARGRGRAGRGRPAPARGRRQVSGRSLDDVLIVDPVAVGVDVETLRAVLASVAVVDRDADTKRGPVVLGLDGSCALGPIRARREVRPAAWVGATARERSRLARKTELEQRAAQLDAERDAEQRAMETLDAAAARATFEAGSLRGGDREYTAARSRRHAAEVAVEVARSSARVAEEEVTAARAAGRDARLAASSFQREHDLPDRDGRRALSRRARRPALAAPRPARARPTGSCATGADSAPCRSELAGRAQVLEARRARRGGGRRGAGPARRRARDGARDRRPAAARRAGRVRHDRARAQGRAGDAAAARFRADLADEALRRDRDAGGGRRRAGERGPSRGSRRRWRR